MTQRAGGDDTSSDRTARSRRPDKASPRLLAWAFGISAALHLLAVAIYPLLFDGLRPDGVSFPIPASTNEQSGVEVIRLVEIEEEEEDDPVLLPDEPDEPDAPASPSLIEVPISEDQVEVELLPPGPTAAERLRPRLTDTRIWAPLDRALGELAPALREEILVAGRLQEWYDSVRVAEEAERALTDWTFTTEDGKRWGVADGRLYLGDFSIPAPFEFGVTPGRREEVADRERQFEEITRQARQFEIRGSWRERAEAIRARRDQERAAGDSARVGPGG
jgi:hypothetical protein